VVFPRFSPWTSVRLPWLMFPQAPLRSRTVGFPESGSGLGSARHFPETGLPMPSKAQAMARVHPRLSWFTGPLAPRPGQPRYPGSVSGYGPSRRNRRVPRAPLPVASVARDRAASWTASEDVTLPSSLLRAHAPVPPPFLAFGSPYAWNLRRLLPSPAGRGTFPTLSLQSLWRRLDPYPAVSHGCIYPFLPRGHRPHVTGNTFGTREYPCLATSAGSRISRLQSFAKLQSPPLARPSGCSHHSVRGRRAARPFTPRISRLVAQAGLWHRYVTDLGNCHGWTCTSKITVVSAAPSRIWLVTLRVRCPSHDPSALR
jgi:hypothetical protein